MLRPARRILLAMLMVLLTLQACTSAAGVGPSPTPFGAYSLDPVFSDLYEKLGGQAVLGPVISPSFPHNQESCQYTETVLMCYDPQAKVDADRWYLVPIGTVLVTPAEGPAPKIYEGFMETYHNLFGVRYVGNPISGVQVNQEKHRIEQYFEKMGFYMLTDDPRGTVHLMYFGSAVCRKYCAFEPYADGIVQGWERGIPVPSLSSLQRIGGFKVVGNPISQPYDTAEGTLQLFERALVIIPADNPATIRLGPLSILTKMPQNAPGPQQYGEKEGVSFYALKDSLGYHVPLVFDAFIASHGGLSLSGKPISDTFSVKMPDGLVVRQCFENYCLDYDTRLPEAERVHLADLGALYKKVLVPEEAQVFEFSPTTILFMLSETKPQINSSEDQVIEVSVFQVRGQLPIADIESVLVIGLPDGRKAAYNVPPTGLDGIARITIPAFKNAPNGTVIPYTVCLNVPSRSQICKSNSFLIWNVR